MRLTPRPIRREGRGRRKRRTPRTSSLRGRARRRQRQWYAYCAGFPRDVTPRAVSPSVVVRPEMLGMYQKDSGALIVDPGSGICKACFAGFTPRSVFRGCRQARGQVGLDQKNNYVLGWFSGVDAPLAVLLFFVVRPKMFGIMAGMTQVEICLKEYRKIGVFSGRERHMFPYWYIFMSVYRGLVFCSPLYLAVMYGVGCSPLEYKYMEFSA